MYKKNSKRITLMGEPVNFTDKSKHITLYETNGLIKKVTASIRSYYCHTLLIVDEAKYIKEYMLYSYSRDLDKIQFEKTSEYYVDRYFTGEQPFAIKGMMYFDIYRATKMQNKGSENENLSTNIPAPLNIYYAENLLSTYNSCLYIHTRYTDTGVVK